MEADTKMSEWNDGELSKQGRGRRQLILNFEFLGPCNCLPGSQRDHFDCFQRQHERSYQGVLANRKGRI